jgi:hypothetical protein
MMESVATRFIVGDIVHILRYDYSKITGRILFVCRMSSQYMVEDDLGRRRLFDEVELQLCEDNDVIDNWRKR